MDIHYPLSISIHLIVLCFRMKQPPPLNLDSFNWGSMYELYQQNQMTSEQMAQHVQRYLKGRF